MNCAHMSARTDSLCDRSAPGVLCVRGDGLQAVGQHLQSEQKKPEAGGELPLPRDEAQITCRLHGAVQPSALVPIELEARNG
jgi:hypothetical protein